MNAADRQYAIGSWAREARLHGRTVRNHIDFAAKHSDAYVGTVVGLHHACVAESCWAVAATMLLDWLLREEA